MANNTQSQCGPSNSQTPSYYLDADYYENGKFNSLLLNEEGGNEKIYRETNKCIISLDGKITIKKDKIYNKYDPQNKLLNSEKYTIGQTYCYTDEGDCIKKIYYGYSNGGHYFGNRQGTEVTRIEATNDKSIKLLQRKQSRSQQYSSVKPQQSQQPQSRKSVPVSSYVPPAKSSCILL